MRSSAWIGRLLALVAVAGLFAAAPARAEIEKFILHCDGKLCAFFGASITIPEGWVEDKEATDYFKAQMLLPKGLPFDKAPAKIYAVVRYNPKKQPIADFLPETLADWHSRSKKAKVDRLDDLARPGKPAFTRHRFEADDLPEQGYELQAVTTDSDKDGNDFIVTITLSANSKAAMTAAEAAFFAILQKY